MKKLLVLTLVLAVAGLANAAIVLQASSTSVNPGDTITLSIVATAGELVQTIDVGLITDNGAGGLATVGAFNSALNTGTDNGYNGVDWGFAAGDLAALTAGVTLGSPTVYAGGTIYSYQYKVALNASGVISFTLPDVSDDVFATSVMLSTQEAVGISGTQVNVVPEPMTMGLLALGGLFIRRKK